MNIDDSLTSRKIAFLMQYIDNHVNDAIFLQIVKYAKSVEEVAKTSFYNDITQQNQIAKNITIDDIIYAVNNIM